MRSIDLKLEIDKIKKSYFFIRDSGSDYEHAVYKLILNDSNGEYKTIAEFQGTIKENCNSLIKFIENKKIRILNISGDFELKELLTQSLAYKKSITKK